MYTPDELGALMACSDYVVVCTPLTPVTVGLVSAAAIAAMKPDGVLISLGRGKCVDEVALAAALSAGRIRGAALDVFETEPLPEASPLWGLDNALLTPHCADRTKEFQFESLQFFRTNLSAYLEQGTSGLLNVCDKASGY